MANEIEFVPVSGDGRRFRESMTVRLGDADRHGFLRLDGVARFLQDIATDDSNETDVASYATWVVRRTALRLVAGARWPRYLDVLELTTWCGGVGPAWAERRTNLEVDGNVVVEAVALWVPIDSSGHPLRIREEFFEVYGDAARARKVSGRISAAPIPVGALRRRWQLREADFDVVGHVNNAAVWEAISEIVSLPIRFVSLAHHSSIELGDTVELIEWPGHVWLCVDGEVRVSAIYETD